MKKRILSLLLAMVLTIPISFGMSGMAAYAAGDDYIEIKSVEDLYNVRNDLTANYKLMNDIDLSEVTAQGGMYDYEGRGWNPIGSDDIYAAKSKFTGVFDGNNHSISGLRIYLTDANKPAGTGYSVFVGLFANNAGTIKNLKIIDSNLHAERTGTTKGYGSNRQNTYASVYVAPIAACNEGIIQNCGTEVTCEAAGLGSYYSDIQGSSGTYVLGYGYSGGICCENDGSIDSCYNKSNVFAWGYTGKQGTCGGIAAHNNSSGEITNCYNLGVLGNKSGTYTYQIASGGTIKTSYYYSDNNDSVTGTYYGVDGKTNTLNGTQMLDKDSYHGFDFDSVWIIDTGADYKYPQLRKCRHDLGREIDMIELKSAPNKITYKTGDEFDPTGCVVTVFYKDNGSEDINVTADMLSGYDMSIPGIQEVTFTYREYSLSFKINVNQRPEITGMELTSQPLKTTFIRGTAFDFTGAVAQLKYKDGTTEDFLIDAKDCTGGDINTSGDYEITYTKFGHSVKFNVSVVPVREEGIHIESLPGKTSYIEGEDIDTTGLEVYVDYNSGASAPIEDYTIADYDNSAGTQTITVQYKEFEATFEVSFAEKNVLSIEVTKQPNKTEYVFGQKFDPTGMVVTANLDNGKTEEVTGYVVSPMEDRNGMQDLTVSYAGKTTYVTVLVTQRALDSISITTKPYKLTYIEGSEFDPEGMVVTAKYNDDTTEVITDYSMTKLGKTPGNKTIVVSYNGKTTTLAVTVIAKTVVSLSVTAPNKVNYVKGEEFDPTGMVVTALYNDGTTAEVTDYRVAGFGESDEVNILEISYGGKSESIVVTIHEPGSWKITRVATCTTAGQETLACLECGEVIETREIPRTNHNMKKTAAKAATTEQEGNIEYWTCSSCGKHFADANGSKEITKEATVIPKKEKTEPSETTPSDKTPSDTPSGKTPSTPSASDKQMGADGTATGAGASAAVAEKAITTMKSDTDPAGSAFGKVQLKSTKQTKTSVTLKWKKVGGATKYVVYGNKCGKTTKPQKLATSGKASYVVKKVAGKKLKKGTYYKFIVVALDRNNKVVSTSKLIHAATKGGKVGNDKSVNVDKSVVKKAKSLKKGKSLKLKAKAVAASKKLKVQKHVAVRYESSNPAIATVSKSGKVKAKKAGKCNIYAYAQNGVAKTVKVVVK